MSEDKIPLASDNWSPAHPLVLQAVIDANLGYAPAYGADRWTEEAQKKIQEAMEVPCKVFIIPTGTGSNVLGLKIACRRYESVLCTDIAHIAYQESGAAESIAGCKLLTIAHHKGKLTPDAIEKKLKTERAFGKHSTAPRIVSLTQPTEIGTVYSLKELIAISKLCKEENLLVHMDGSRLYNAAAYLNVSLAEIVKAASLDILSLGGTKNGLMGTEALVIFNTQLQEGSDHLHKQTLQLLSKMRYLSAQYIPFFTQDLWRTLALQANQKAQEVAAIIQSIPELSLTSPVETNQIFFTAPPSWIPHIQEKISCHLWDMEKHELRWVTSWSTSEQDIQSVKTITKEISNTNNR